MATFNSALTPQKVKSNSIVVSSAMASVNTDTPTNTVELVAPGTDGARLTRLEVFPRGAAVAGRVVAYRGDASVKRAWRSKSIAAHTWSTTVDPTAVQAPDFGFSDANPAFFVGPNDKLYIGLTVASPDGICVYAEWADY